MEKPRNPATIRLRCRPPGGGRRGRRPIPRLRERILSSASELFGDKGFEQVLTDEVAAHAGVGKGSVYRQFASKEELYAAAVIEGLVQLRTRIEEALSGAQSIVERVTLIVRLTLSYFWDRHQFFAMLRDPAKVSPRTEARYRKERGRLALLISGVLAEGARDGAIRTDLDFSLMAEALLGMMRGVRRYKGDSVLIEEAIQTVVSVFLDGGFLATRTPR